MALHEEHEFIVDQELRPEDVMAEIPMPDAPSNLLFADEKDDFNMTSDDFNMTSFVGSYMTGILKPFAQNVEEMHRTIIPIADNLQEVVARTESNTESVSAHGALITGLHADLLRTKEQLAQIQEMMRTKEASDADAEADKSSTMGRLIHFADNVGTLQAAVEELQQSVRDTNARITRTQDWELRNELIHAKLVQDLEGLTSEMNQKDYTHQVTAQLADKALCTLQTEVQELHALLQDKEQHRQTVLDSKLEASDKSHRALYDKVTEAERLVQQHQKNHSDTLCSLQVMLQRQNAGDVLMQEAQGRLNRAETDLTDLKVVTHETRENLNWLIGESDRNNKDMHNWRSHANNAFARHEATLVEYQGMLHGDAEEREQYGVDSNRILRLLADAKLGGARFERLENMFGLEPLTLQSVDSDEALVMRCGVMMTKKQVKLYQEKFDSLDTNHSGKIGVDKIETLLKDMGLNPPREFVEAKIAEIDTDGTLIKLDEFCAVMAKCSDLEGTMEKELEALQERQRLEEERKQKEKEARELTLNLKDKLKAHEDALKVEFSKLIKTDRKVKGLEDLQADLASQVKKMCDSQQRNEALWQGLSQGLKDTHRTVTQEGEGEMLPSAARLRSTLPSITPPPPQRPASSTGFSNPPRSAR